MNICNKLNKNAHRRGLLKLIIWSVAGLFIAGSIYLIVWAVISGPIVVYRVISNGCDTNIDDYKYYPGRNINTGPYKFHYKQAENEERIPKVVALKGKENLNLDNFLEQSDSIAFLVIKDDVICYERYFQGHSENAISMAFSASKSILSILIGVAVDEGLIESVNQKVTDFVPELAQSGFDNVTLKSLLQMRSGMDYVENDNPFGEHVRFNYTAKLRDEILALKMVEHPDNSFSYKSADNALLSLILERALKTKTITQYTQEKLWEPLGMEHSGIWTLDHAGDGLERTWCGLSATARDFSKFGRLFLNKGNWDGKQIVSAAWVEESTTGAFDTLTWPSNATREGFENYGYQWWLGSEKRGDYLARGKNGQFIYVNPHENVIIVRLGWSNGDAGFGKLSHGDWLSLFVFLAQNIQ